MRIIKILLVIVETLICFQLFAFHVLEHSDESSTLNFKKPNEFAYSSINNKLINVNPNHFKFMVSGHFHGSSSSASGMPASSLMSNLDTINSLNLAFTVCLGDLFLNVERDYKNFEKYLFKKLNMPLFNAVGNHDIDNETYTKRYGKTYEYFDIGTNRFIILNTELNNGDIKGEQLSILKEALGSKLIPSNIFIFMHRTLWAEEDDRLQALFPDNTKSATATNFQDEILPLIRKASKNSRIYLFSGSIGGQAPASFLYHKLGANITVIATAIRDLPRDAILLVGVNDSEVDFQTISLNSNKVLPLQNYTVEWWEKNGMKKKPFNWRLIPLYLWQMITHRYFWYGVFYSISFFLIFYLYKFFKKNRNREII